MKANRKILLVATGVLRNPLTWSGVPLRLLEEFERVGYEVVYADMSRVPYIKLPRILFNRVIRRVVKKWRTITFETTRLGLALQSFWFRRLAARHADVERIVACSFCLDAGGIAQPVTLVQDWPNGYMQQMFARREMTAEERAGDERQFVAMKAARDIVSLYPLGARYLREHGLAQARFICNPINVRGLEKFRLGDGSGSRHVLLVGGESYQENVDCTIRALNRLGDSSIVLDVVGVTSSPVESTAATVRFYGYLDRSNSSQLATYNALYDQARCVVNVRGGWGGGSSIAEALYRGKPIVVGDYAEIKALYGVESGRFGYYCRQVDEVDLAEKLRLMFSLDEKRYLQMCRAAYETAKNDTFERFVKGLEGGLEDGV